MIVVKGIILKRYYPDPELRTMGDIDFMVRNSDVPKVEKIMHNFGFKLEAGSVGEHIFIKDGFCVEIHDNFGSEDLGTGVDYNKVILDVFDKTVVLNDNNNELPVEWHLIYLILHIAQHLVSTGCGVRQIMDVALLIKNSDVNMFYVREKLAEIKLDSLAKNVFYLCKKWFDINCTDFVPNNRLCEAFEDYIISGGTFGLYSNRDNNKMKRESKYKGNKLIILINYIFPDVTEMKCKVVWFRKGPVALLPIAWAYRWVNILMNKPDRVKRYFNFLVSKENDEINREFEMLKSLGFYKIHN